MLSKYTLVSLTSEHNLDSFDCGDDDLNDFVKNDALEYSVKLLATTYLFLDNKNEVVAFFSVANDRVSLMGNCRTKWNRLNRKIANRKRNKTYPAVLLARLGVSKKHQGKNIGSSIIEFIKGWFTVKNKTGCRFLLVDAYNQEKVCQFYEKNDFSFLKEDESEKTRSMYYDLIRSLPENIS